MCPSLIEIGSKTAEKKSAHTNKQTDRHYGNNGHLAVNNDTAVASADCSRPCPVVLLAPPFSQFGNSHYPPQRVTLTGMNETFKPHLHDTTCY